LRRIPARRSGGGSVSRGGRRGKAAGKRGGSIGFCSSTQLAKERGREREGAVTAEPRTAGGLVGGRRVLGEAVAHAKQDSKARLERRARSG
jgi:hypothetical protein